MCEHNNSVLTNAIFLLSGALLSGIVGFWFSNLTRKSEKRDQALSKIYATCSLTMDTSFKKKACDQIQEALCEAKPFVSHAKFLAAQAILDEFEKIEYTELAAHKGIAKAWEEKNNKTTKQRVLEFCDRIKNELV